MKIKDSTIYDKIRSFIVQNGNIASIRVIRDFIEKQCNNKAFLVETPSEVISKGYYTFSYLDIFNITITIYLDTNYEIKIANPTIDTKVKILSLVCVIT